MYRHGSEISILKYVTVLEMHSYDALTLLTIHRSLEGSTTMIEK